MHTAPIRGVKYAYTDSGGVGPLVLFLHGWPDDRSLWRHQIDYLSALGWRVVAIDWPFHGDSERGLPVRRANAVELAADIDAFIAHLDVQRVHLVAHDYGATIAWETVERYPQRFLSFCAISVGHSAEILGDMLRGALLRYYWLILHGLPRLSRWCYLHSGAARFERKFQRHPDRAHILQRLRSDADQSFWTVWERANPALGVAFRYLSQRLRGSPRATIEPPTLGIYSTEDEWMTEGQMKRSGSRVRSRWRYLNTAGGHWIPLENPDFLNRSLEAWISEVEAASAADSSSGRR